MVQVIEQQGSPFGRLGKGIGQGLADQVPKEIERNRLASGLQQFEKESANLNPIQTLARLSSIPGITPQMIQSFGELAKQQQTRNAYQNNANPSKPMEPSRVKREDTARATSDETGGRLPNPDQNVSRDAVGQPQIVNVNPLGAVNALPWTTERRNQERASVSQQFPNFTKAEIDSEVKENEARELALPEAVQKQNAYLKDVQDAVDNRFTQQLETKLEKSGKDVFQDITGENLVNLKRGLEKELRDNPNLSVDDVVNKWTNKALDFARAKSEIKTLSSRDIYDRVLRPTQTFEKLKSYQKIYRDSNNLEEFYNLLKTSSDNGGFDLSPQVASQITYPRSEGVRKYISTRRIPLSNPIGESGKIAAELFNKNIIRPEDSLLAIAKDLREKGPFDQNAFFKYIRDNQDELGLTGRQKRELGVGEGDKFPTWGDLSVLPGGYK